MPQIRGIIIMLDRHFDALMMQGHITRTIVEFIIRLIEMIVVDRASDFGPQYRGK